jgi:hypothetical protein
MWWLPLFSLLPILAFALAIRWVLRRERRELETLRRANSRQHLRLPFPILPAAGGATMKGHGAPRQPMPAPDGAKRPATFAIALHYGNGKAEPNLRQIVLRMEPQAPSTTTNPSDSYRTVRIYLHSQAVAGAD